MADYDRSQAKCLCAQPAPFVTDDLKWLCSVCGCSTPRPVLTSPNKSHLDVEKSFTLLTPGSCSEWLKNQFLDDDPESRAQWAKEHLHQWPEGSTEESTTFWPEKFDDPTISQHEPCGYAVSGTATELFNANEQVFAYDHPGTTRIPNSNNPHSNDAALHYTPEGGLVHPFSFEHNPDLPLAAQGETIIWPGPFVGCVPIRPELPPTTGDDAPRPPRSVSYPYLQISREHGVRYGAVLDFLDSVDRGATAQGPRPWYSPWELAVIDAWLTEHTRRRKVLSTQSPHRQGKTFAGYLARIRSAFSWGDREIGR